jgi:hypothetical protein
MNSENAMYVEGSSSRLKGHDGMYRQIARGTEYVDVCCVMRPTRIPRPRPLVLVFDGKARGDRLSISAKC